MQKVYATEVVLVLHQSGFRVSSSKYKASQRLHFF